MPCTLQNFTFRINGQSGDALDSGDDLEVSDFKISLARPSDSVIVSGGGYIAEPKEGGFPEFRVTFRIPRKNTVAKTLYTAITNGTLQKAEAIYGGSSASRELKFSFPQLFVESVVIPFEEVVYADVTLRVQKASAAPTGMTGITMPTAAWQCGTASAVIS